jgi:hypothetical protein
MSKSVSLFHASALANAAPYFPTLPTTQTPQVMEIRETSGESSTSVKPSRTPASSGPMTASAATIADPLFRGMHGGHWLAAHTAAHGIAPV